MECSDIKETIQKLLNCSQDLKPFMAKIAKGEELPKENLRSVLELYLETVHVLGQIVKNHVSLSMDIKETIQKFLNCSQDPFMAKVAKGEELSKENLRSVLKLYLETVDVLVQITKNHVSPSFGFEGAMTGNDQILIDSLDGFEFEEVCAEIYRRLGYSVQSIQYTNDEGRDLVLKSPEGETIVVECKHWLGGSISRPIVQKLHSAIITLPAKRGIILTTGSFGKPARDYVAKVKERIELVDLFKLKDLAARVGITLTSSKESIPILSYHTAEDKILKSQLDSQVFSQFMSSPAKPESLFSIIRRHIELVPAYCIRYSLNQDFSTSVGLIHRIDVRDATLLIDAEHGQCFSEDITNFMKTVPFFPFAKAVGLNKAIPKGSFKLGMAELRDIAKEHITRIQRTSVGYRGSNNHHYTLQCVPNKKNILLKDIQQVYLPEQDLQIRVLNHQYELHLLENERSFYWLKHPDIFVCELCHKTFHEGLLCNSCGAVVHRPRLMWTHSFRCKNCGKTICKLCAYWVRHWLFFKKVLCYQCSAAYPAEKIRKLVA